MDDLTVLRNCRILRGGSGSRGAITISFTRPSIRDCRIEGSPSWGIFLDGDRYPDPDSLERENRFADNDSGAVRRPDPGRHEARALRSQLQARE